MSGLFKGIQSVISVIQTLVNNIKLGLQFLLNLVKMTVELVKLLITTVVNLTQLIATLPPWLLAFASATVAVAVLYIVLGRETGK